MFAVKKSRFPQVHHSSRAPGYGQKIIGYARAQNDRVSSESLCMSKSEKKLLYNLEQTYKCNDRSSRFGAGVVRDGTLSHGARRVLSRDGVNNVVLDRSRVGAAYRRPTLVFRETKTRFFFSFCFSFSEIK